MLIAAMLGISVVAGGCGKKPESSADDGGTAVPAPAATGAGAQGGIKAEPITVESAPRPEGAELVMATADTRAIMLRGPVLLEASKEFYETELAKLGWQIDAASSEVADGVGFLDFRSGELKLTVTLNPERDGKTMTYILQGSGVEVADEEAGEDGS
jgi:hypothetical protein